MADDDLPWFHPHHFADRSPADVARIERLILGAMEEAGKVAWRAFVNDLRRRGLGHDEDLGDDSVAYRSFLSGFAYGLRSGIKIGEGYYRDPP